VIAVRVRALPLTQRSPRPRRRRGFARDGGFTLIEVLVSALLVGLIASAAATALVSTAHTSADQRFRSQADGLATQDQERLRGLSDQQLDSLSQSRSSTVDGTAFTVRSTSTYEDTTGATSCNSTAAAYFRIVSTVSWTEGASGQSPSITEESILSRPVTGDLLSKVTDQTGAALPGVTISTTGPATSSSAGPLAQTALSDSNGCVMFAALTPGLYTVGLSYNGWVDPSGNAAPTGAATVTTTGLAAQPNNGVFHLGNPGTIVGTFKTAATGGYTGEADGLSWNGSKGSIPMPNMETAPTADPSTPGTGYTTGSLFPFASVSPTDYTQNYSVWGGRCSGQQPPTGSNPNLFTVTPGSTGTAQTIQEPLLNLQAVQYNNGTSTSTVTPADIVLTFSDGTCSDSWKATRAASMSATTGWLANPGQAYAPAGDLTVCADYKPSGGNYYKASVTTGNTSFASANAVPTITIVKSGTGSTTPSC
jgi:prepilin-type N-terminal cleavage/methylation domain-containing protein